MVRQLRRERATGRITARHLWLALMGVLHVAGRQARVGAGSVVTGKRRRQSR